MGGFCTYALHIHSIDSYIRVCIFPCICVSAYQICSFFFFFSSFFGCYAMNGFSRSCVLVGCILRPLKNIDTHTLWKTSAPNIPIIWYARATQVYNLESMTKSLRGPEGTYGDKATGLVTINRFLSRLYLPCIITTWFSRSSSSSYVEQDSHEHLYEIQKYTRSLKSRQVWASWGPHLDKVGIPATTSSY